MFPSTEVAYDSAKLCFISRLELLRGVSQEAVYSFNAMMRSSKRRRGEWVWWRRPAPGQEVTLRQAQRLELAYKRTYG